MPTSKKCGGPAAQPASHGDLARAREALRRLPDAPAVDWAIGYATALVDDRWTDICRLAGALLEARTMDYAEVVAALD